MGKLEQRLQEYWQAKTLANEAYDKAKEAKAVADSIKDDILAEMHSFGTKSFGDDDFTAAVAEHVNIQIMHEPSVIDWLKHQPQIEPDLYIGLKKTAFDGLARAVMAKDGEKIPGTELEVTEYLTIRKGKKDGK